MRYIIGTRGSALALAQSEQVRTLLPVSYTHLRVTKDTNEDGALDQFGVYGYGWQNAVASNGATVFYAEGTKATLSDERVYEAIEFTRRLEELNQGMTPTSEMFDKGPVSYTHLLIDSHFFFGFFFLLLCDLLHDTLKSNQMLFFFSVSNTYFFIQ